MNNASQAYLQSNVNTAGQGELLLMLYDGAIKFLEQAKVKMAERDYAKKGMLISKAIDIINELAGSLNMEKGGSISENLNNLYFFCTTHLLQANMKMDASKIDNVINVLSGLRGAYAEIIETPEARAASQQIAMRMAPSSNVSVRQMAASQSPNIGAAGQSYGRSVYGQQAQVSKQPLASVATDNVMPQVMSEASANALPQVQSAPSAFSALKSNVVSDMNVAKVAMEGQNEPVKNADIPINNEANINTAQNSTPASIIEAAKKNAFGSASRVATEGQNGISALSKRPLSALNARSSKIMSLYGKVGQ